MTDITRLRECVGGPNFGGEVGGLALARGGIVVEWEGNRW